MKIFVLLLTKKKTNCRSFILTGFERRVQCLAIEEASTRKQLILEDSENCWKLIQEEKKESYLNRLISPLMTKGKSRYQTQRGGNHSTKGNPNSKCQYTRFVLTKKKKKKSSYIQHVKNGSKLRQ
ncbi:hypothetical protein CEXT_99501 [Caerostris extrusa]|uniref:Uncharacterized protein n=1 Tax=Caerostris extrusa TaxID=172846 RepID=A0AAV4XGK9_CAEEX|nr:hypothetical protein CEXT_99501 [Caerostris extrusa]